MIKVIAFDYAGVVSPGPMTEWVKTYLDIRSRFFIHNRKSMSQWRVKKLFLDKSYAILSTIVRYPQGVIWGTLYDRAGLNQDVLEIIKGLKKNYKVVLFSNFLGDVLRKLLKKHDAEEFFDEIIISSEHKTKKPNPEFFDVLIRISGVKKDEILFIDDTKRNFEAAKEFGINAILYRDSETLKKELERLKISL